MNKNYREWGSTGLGSAFQSKLDHLRDLHDLEVLTSKYACSSFAAPAATPTKLNEFGSKAEFTLESQAASALPIDPESLLYNRSHFDQTLEYEANRALRYHRHLSICIVRIDSLDAMRARLRSQDVSRLIAKLSRALKDSLRGIDIPARFDDRSFAIILPETNTEGVSVVAERIRGVLKTVASTRIESSEQEFAVRTSIGCAGFPSHAKTAQGLLDCAMKSLETASERGGDMVCML
jgi:diguanylate cyclase (GGDEF)-like protein